MVETPRCWGLRLTWTRSMGKALVTKGPVTEIRQVIDGSLRISDTCRVNCQDISPPASDLLIAPDIPDLVRRSTANNWVNLFQVLIISD